MTDEPCVEIAACPMPGCGERCFVASSTHWGVGGNKRVVCAKCTYSSRDFELSADAIAAHNALCADVRRGREAEAIERERDALKDELAQAAQSRALLDATAQELRRENGVLRAGVERLREAIARWRDSLDCLYSTNDLRGADYFDYELKSKMEDEMRAALNAGQDQ